MSSSPPNDAITRIPLLQRIFLYSTIKLSVLTSFAAVHSSWQDCVHNYSHGIFASWVSPTRATLEDLAAKKVQGMIDDVNNKRERMGLASATAAFGRANIPVPNYSSNSDGPSPSAIHRALQFLASQAMSQDESAIRQYADNPGLLLESVRDARLREAKRSLSGGLVRGCQFGFFWLVVNILESPSPFAQNDPSHGIFLLSSSEPAANVQQNLQDAAAADHLTQFDVPLYNDKHFIVDPVKCTFYSGTPIFAAVSGGHHDVVRYLVAKTRGAVICKKIMQQQQHHHPQHLSIETHYNIHEGEDEDDDNNNDDDDDDELITSNDRTNEHEGESNPAKAEMVMEYVLDLNERTPLFNALAIGPEMMEILLDAGCDHRILDYAGDDVVNVCATNGYLNSLKWLLEVRLPELKMVELAMNPHSGNADEPQAATVKNAKNSKKATDKKPQDAIVDPNRIFWDSYPDEFKKRTRALDNAAAMGHAKIVEYLVGDGVGCIVSPATLQSASRSGSAECVRLVIDAMKKSGGAAFVSTDLTSARRAVEFASVVSQKDDLLEMLDDAKKEFPKYAKKSTEFRDSRLFDDDGGNCCGL